MVAPSLPKPQPPLPNTWVVPTSPLAMPTMSPMPTLHFVGENKTKPCGQKAKKQHFFAPPANKWVLGGLHKACGGQPMLAPHARHQCQCSHAGAGRILHPRCENKTKPWPSSTRLYDSIFRKNSSKNPCLGPLHCPKSPSVVPNAPPPQTKHHPS